MNARRFDYKIVQLDDAGSPERVAVWLPGAGQKPSVVHEVHAGYDGEGVYAWSCTCGDGKSDFTGEDAATIAGTEHLLDVGAVPA